MCSSDLQLWFKAEPEDHLVVVAAETGIEVVAEVEARLTTCGGLYRARAHVAGHYKSVLVRQRRRGRAETILGVVARLGPEHKVHDRHEPPPTAAVGVVEPANAEHDVRNERDEAESVRCVVADRAEDHFTNDDESEPPPEITATRAGLVNEVVLESCANRCEEGHGATVVSQSRATKYFARG